LLTVLSCARNYILQILHCQLLLAFMYQTVAFLQECRFRSLYISLVLVVYDCTYSLFQSRLLFLRAMFFVYVVVCCQALRTVWLQSMTWTLSLRRLMLYCAPIPWCAVLPSTVISGIVARLKRCSGIRLIRACSCRAELINWLKFGTQTYCE